MSSVLYKEEQSVRESVIPFIMVPVWLGMVGVFTWGFYEQMVKGRPWGDEPMNNTALLVTGIGSIVLIGAFVLLMLNGKLILEVRNDGFYYLFSPFIRKMKQIPREEIASARIIKISLYSRMNQKGIHHSILSRTTSYSLGGSQGAEIITNSGKRLIFSVKRPADMENALNSMMSATTRKYNLTI